MYIQATKQGKYLRYRYIIQYWSQLRRGPARRLRKNVEPICAVVILYDSHQEERNTQIRHAHLATSYSPALVTNPQALNQILTTST